MPCYHPCIIIQGSHSKYIGSKEWHPEYKPGEHLIDPQTGEVQQVVEIPCGQCIGCRLEHSRQWANRCMIEAMSYTPDRCWWLTLTYNDSNVPLSDIGTMTLRPKDLQDWLKRLRRDIEYRTGEHGVRFYACGEYGDNTARPHYHVCLFNVEMPDLQYSGKNRLGDLFYKSPLIDRTWGSDDQGLGLYALTPLTWQNAAYTARYVCKKYNGTSSDVYKKAHIQPEYCVMSRRPGIAHDYYVDNLDRIYQYDSITLPAVRGKGNRSKPPRYADKILDMTDHVRLMAIKDRRLRCAQLEREARARYTDMPEDKYLMMQEDVLQDRIKKSLARVDI